MKFLTTIIILVTVILSDVSPLKILVHSPAFAGSHTNFMARIADSLTEAGHNVTFLVPVVDEAKRDQLGVKLTKDVVVIEQDEEMKSQVFPLDTMMKKFWTQEVDSSNAPNNVITFHYLSVLSCANMFRNKKILDQLRDANYDVGITEPLQVNGLALFRYLGIEKTIISSSCVNYDVLIPATGEPEETSYLPAMSTHGTDQMNFAERLENYRAFYVQEASYSAMFDDETAAYRKYIGADFPDWRELIRDASLHLVNSIPFIDFPRPAIQKTIPIGGISVDMDKIRLEKVTPELDEILDRREHNMFISFGSIAKSTEMPENFRENLLNVIKSEPNVTFIWKYESDDTGFAKGIDNLVFLKWAPQTTLLNDKRLTAFLGHGGLGSTNEAAYMGKPSIMVPIFADQSRNANMVARHGMSIMLPKRFLGNFQKVQSAFRSVLYDAKYRVNAGRVAEMLHNQPSKPKEIAVKYIEFVGKYGPLHHMTPYSLMMPWYQRNNYDIYAYNAASYLAVFLFLYLVFRAVAYFLQNHVAIVKKTV